MSEDLLSLEAVYYPCAIPSSLTLTHLGLIFDKIHFPGVGLPSDGLVAGEIRKEIDRIRPLSNDYVGSTMLRAMEMLESVVPLSEFCVFRRDIVPPLGYRYGAEVEQFVESLHDKLFPNRSGQGFFTAFDESKTLPGGQTIGFPPGLYYPAVAMDYARRSNMPLVTDDALMPGPMITGEAVKNNTKLLMTLLAMECAKLILPKLEALRPEQIVEMRQELEKYVRPFRRAILQLASDLNDAISKSSSQEDVLEAVRFTVETKIYPTVSQLREAAENPKRPWATRAYGVVKQVPEIVAACGTMQWGTATTKSIGALADFFIDWQSQQAKKEAARSPMYYLLKLGDAKT